MNEKSIHNGNIYMQDIAERHHNIELNNNKMSGMPCIKGTRINVSFIIACLRNGESISDIMQDYYLTKEQVIEALNYIEDILDRPYL